MGNARLQARFACPTRRFAGAGGGIGVGIGADKRVMLARRAPAAVFLGALEGTGREELWGGGLSPEPLGAALPLTYRLALVKTLDSAASR